MPSALVPLIMPLLVTEPPVPTIWMPSSPPEIVPTFWLAAVVEKDALQAARDQAARQVVDAAAGDEFDAVLRNPVDGAGVPDGAWDAPDQGALGAT